MILTRLERNGQKYLQYKSYPHGKMKFFITHDPERCVGQPCVVHNPSKHHMSNWPMNWREDRYMMERLCEHGVGHPDPDHMFFIRNKYGHDVAQTEGVHGCDGCCVK